MTLFNEQIKPLSYKTLRFYKEQGYVSVDQNPCFAECKEQNYSRWS